MRRASRNVCATAGHPRVRCTVIRLSDPCEFFVVFVVIVVGLRAAELAAHLGDLLTQAALCLVIAAKALDGHREFGAQLVNLRIRLERAGRIHIVAAKVEPAPDHWAVENGRVARIRGKLAFFFILMHLYLWRGWAGRCLLARLDAAEFALQVRHIALEASAFTTRRRLLHLALARDLLEFFVDLLGLLALLLIRLAQPRELRTETRALRLGAVASARTRRQFLFELLARNVQVPVLLTRCIHRALQRVQLCAHGGELLDRIVTLALEARVFRVGLIRHREQRYRRLCLVSECAAHVAKQRLGVLLDLMELSEHVLLELGRVGLLEVLEHAFQLALVLKKPLSKHSSRVCALPHGREAGENLVEWLVPHDAPRAILVLICGG